MKIGIIGGGVVGHATARAFIEHVDEVLVYDSVPERSTSRLETVLRADIIFVCLPTPQSPDGLGCDLSSIHNFFRSADEKLVRRGNFVLRSTVPIGTTKRLAKEYYLSNLVHSPEFLTARCAATDAHLPARNIIGSPACVATVGHPNPCYDSLYGLYERRFPGVQILNMTSDESEAVKLFTNGFFAVKLAYFNEIKELADWHDLDWDRVLKGVLSDGRIAHSHTKVPGPDGKPGFGGSCLPKDLASLIDQLLSTDKVALELVTHAALLGNRSRRGA